MSNREADDVSFFFFFLFHLVLLFAISPGGLQRRDVEAEG